MKGFGLLLIAAVPMLYGFFRGEELRRSDKIQSALTSFFQFAKNEIALYFREQREIFSAYEDPLLEKIGFLPFLRNEVEKKPCLALQRSIEALPDGICFSQTEKRAIREFARCFGMQSKASQLADFDKLLSVLRDEEKKRKSELAGRIKLNRAVGITVGLGIYILLI